MTKRIVVSACAALLLATSTALGSTPFIEEARENAKPNIQWDVETGKLPAFVFSGTQLPTADAVFYCSKSSGAVWARIGSTIYQVNKPSADPNLKIGEDGKTMPSVPLASTGNVVANNPDVATRIVAQAERSCNPAPVVVRDGSQPGPMEFAYGLCAIADATGQTTAPCDVSIWSESISASFNVSPKDGKAVCLELKSIARKKNWRFPTGWKIEILSPYSGGKPVAFCDL